MVRLENRCRISRQNVRSIFISDTHLGCRFAQANALLNFFDCYSSNYLYLVGDIIDGRSLERNWCWKPAFTDVLSEIFHRANQGTVVRYATGNHDDFLRHPKHVQELFQNRGIQVADDFVHRTADGRKMLIIHGDLFDTVEQSAAWVSKSVTVLYETLLALNSKWDQFSSIRPHRKLSLSSRIKKNVKGIVKYVSDFEKQLADHARALSCHGVICGHIHTPLLTNWNDLTYCNTGDWVENCTALIEHTDGRLELIYHDDLVRRLSMQQELQTGSRSYFATSDLSQNDSIAAAS